MSETGSYMKTKQNEKKIIFHADDTLYVNPLLNFRCYMASAALC